MGKKTIYVKDEDEQIFQKAQELAGDSLSGVIAEALRQYVNAEKAKKDVVLEVGYWRPKGTDDIQKISFPGRLLAEGTDFCGQTSSRDDRGIDWKIYQTEKGKFLVYWKHWSRWENEGVRADYVILSALPERGTTFLGTATGELSGEIPGSIIEDAAEELRLDIVKHLDI